MEKPTDYLWYIIPGGLALFPLAVKFFPELNGNLEGIGLLGIPLLFIAGFIVHQIYRLIYNSIIFPRRTFIKWLRNKLGYPKKIKGRYIDAIYNYFIYSQKEFESQIKMIKSRSHRLSSLFSCMIGIVIGLIFCIYFKIYAFIGIIYFITGIIFFFGYYFLYKIMSDNEKTLVSDNFHKFDKKKIERILRNLLN